MVWIFKKKEGEKILPACYECTSPHRLLAGGVYFHSRGDLKAVAM